MFSGGSVTIRTGDTEPIEVLLRDNFGEPLLGATDIKIQIRRISDNRYFDWSDNTFKIDVTQRLQTLTEIDSTTDPGAYYLDHTPHSKGFNTAAVTNPTPNDVYEVTILNTGADPVPGLPLGFEIKVGFYIDQLYTLPPHVADAVWDAMQADHTVQGSFGNLLRRIVALQKENYVIDHLEYNSIGLMTRGRIRLFLNRDTALLATKDGQNEGEFASYTFTTVPQIDKTERADFVRSVKD